MMFAPRQFWYFPVERGAIELAAGAPQSIAEEVRSMNGAYAWTSSGRGFLVKLSCGEQVIAVVVVEDLMFPEHREQYLNMALAMVDVAALAVESARTRQTLNEAEKMASLSVLVAGVAHEISTPVGVCLTAASSLDRQVETLGTRFAARAMTQSDLNRFLQAAASESRLIVGNLERVGLLIESFRKVAVERTPRAKKPFVLRSLIEQSIASSGPNGLGNSLTVEIDCDPNLTINSYASDWASIVTNLYGNSMRHAFKGRKEGSIRIVVRADETEIVFEFSDNGVGLEAGIRKRIFDPFFTTDLQHGMGLGMHLVYNLVRQSLAGTIACDSDPGKGARFRIVVPR